MIVSSFLFLAFKLALSKINKFNKKKSYIFSFSDAGKKVAFKTVIQVLTESYFQTQLLQYEGFTVADYIQNLSYKFEKYKLQSKILALCFIITI